MKSSFTLIEVLVALAIVVIMMGVIFPSFQFLTQRTARVSQDVQARLAIQEGVEVAYNVLEGSWEGSAPGIYHPEELNSPAAWTLLPGADQVLAKYNRQIEILRVCRNNTDYQRLDDAVCVGPDRNWDDSSKLIRVSLQPTSGGTASIAELLVTKP